MKTKPTATKTRPNRKQKLKTKPKVQHKTSDSIRAFLIALFAALVLRQFVIASYNVPTGSMKDTIMVGDFMFVNKFIFGARSPLYLGIPFTDIGTDTLPTWLRFQLPAITEPKEREIIVFDYPVDPKVDYIKRCIATGGKTLEVKNNIAYVDGVPEGNLELLGVERDPKEFDAAQQRMIRTIPSFQYTRVTSPLDKQYTIRTLVNLRATNPSYPLTTLPKDSYFMMGDNRDNSQDSREWGPVKRSYVGGKPLMIWLSVDTREPFHRFYNWIRWDRLGKVLH